MGDVRQRPPCDDEVGDLRLKLKQPQQCGAEQQRVI
jgi:hypothetical protein